MKTLTADPLAHCPFCGEATAGPLAGCDDPKCQRLETEMDHYFVRLEDGDEDHA
jgi:hypothetical protein